MTCKEHDDCMLHYKSQVLKTVNLSCKNIKWFNRVESFIVTRAMRGDIDADNCSNFMQHIGVLPTGYVIKGKCCYQMNDISIQPTQKSCEEYQITKNEVTLIRE